jgi:type IV pilus assembly protein PilQ
MKTRMMQARILRWAASMLTATLLLPAYAQQSTEAQAASAGVSGQQPIIQSVTGSIQAGAEVLKIDLSQPLATLPNGFSIKAPAKIALDFAGVGNALGRSTIDVNQGNLQSVSLIPAGDRTRVVLNLKQATNYRAELQGRSLFVTLQPVAASTAPAGPAASSFSENRSREALPIKDLDFRSGVNGSGRVIVALPNSQVGVDIRQSGQTLVVEFMKSSLPESLRRKLDVSDFGTPVQAVTAFQIGDRVRMVIEPKGNWEHSAYQSDEQFVVEVKPMRVDPAKLTQGPGFSGQKLSLNFQNIEIRALLQVIADFTNFNVVTSDSVTGNVTLRLQDVPWDQALEIILQSKGLGLRKNGNVLWIAPRDEILAREKLEREANAALETLEPVRTQSFRLNYAVAANVARQLMGLPVAGAGAAPVPVAGVGGAGAASARILSPRGSAIAEPRTNQLFVTDISSRLEQVQDLIAKIDIPVRQVLIEARIVEASDTFGKSLGVRLGGNPFNRSNNSGIGVDFGPVYSGTAIGSTAGTFVNLPAPTVGSNSAAQFAVSIFDANKARFLNLEISALEADGKGKVVSSPRVVTADKVKAVIEQGTELPYQVASASGATSIAFRKANLMLEVTPQITPEGSVILDLDINKDTVGQSTPAGFAIDTKHVKTQVLVENGGTVVIGGIFTQAEQEDTAKVPFFGDLPGVGVLFRNKIKRSEKRELLVFITPKALTDSTTLR